MAAGFENNLLNNDRCVVVEDGLLDLLPTGDVAMTAALLVGPRTTNPTVERNNAVPTVAESMIEVAAAELIFMLIFFRKSWFGFFSFLLLQSTPMMR